MKTKNSNKSEFVTFNGIKFPKVDHIDEMTVKDVNRFQSGVHKLINNLPKFRVSVKSNYEFDCRRLRVGESETVDLNVIDMAYWRVSSDLKSKSIIVDIHVGDETNNITIPFKVIHQLVNVIFFIFTMYIGFRKSLLSFVTNARKLIKVKTKDESFEKVTKSKRSSKRSKKSSDEEKIQAVKSHPKSSVKDTQDLQKLTALKLYTDDQINWDYVSSHRTLSEDLIRDLKDKVNWKAISRYQKLSEEFIREFKDRVDWIYISECQILSEEFIQEFQDKVDWLWISSNQKLSENFIREFQDKLNWTDISIYQKLSENFIREFKDRVDWIWIPAYQQLSENFIREFKDRLNWSGLQMHCKLSEDFIREFKDKVDWTIISESTQDYSKEFLDEFKDEIAEGRSRLEIKFP